MAAPLYDFLREFSGRNPLRLHMPGHKGRMGGLFRDIASIDVTELDPTGNLYTGEGPIAQAERLFAQTAGARDALFFSCGSTQGIFTMLAAAGRGGTLILDRGCHKSVYHGMALLNITPVYLTPEPELSTGLPKPVSPPELEAALTAHPEAKAVLLTTPSYYGVITPLPELAALCRSRGVYLLIDQAHGAHFPFLGLPSAIQEGADLAVVSAHKTLPALGSSATLYVGQDAPWTALELKGLSSVFATTSPSWPILASIDWARDYLEKTDGYPEAARRTALLRDRIEAETPFHALHPVDGLALDPCRLTVDTATGGLSGREADRLLQAENIYLEMSDERYLVAILTGEDTPSDMERFLAALKRLPAHPAIVPQPEPFPAPVSKISLQAALFGPRERTVLAEAAGRIAAQIIAPYPPGVPIIAPGEEITEKHIAYLQKKSYNVWEEVFVSPLP